MTFSVRTLHTKCCYAECGLCWVSLTVSVIILNFIMPSVIMANVMASVAC